MLKFLVFLHLLFAIFAVGPLVGAASVAARGVRAGDAAAVAASARTVRIYSYASIAVAVIGLGMVQKKWHNEFGDTWIWLSLILYLAALALSLAVLVPSLGRVADALNAPGGSATPAGPDPGPLVARIAASGGVITLLFAVIILLMVYKPGRS